MIDVLVKLLSMPIHESFLVIQIWLLALANQPTWMLVLGVLVLGVLSAISDRKTPP